jgi:copper transport protein
VFARSSAIIGFALKFAALLLLWSVALPGQAHALLERSAPGAGVVLPADRPIRSVSLWFTERVSVAPGAIAVFAADQRRVDRLTARISPDEPARVDVELGEHLPDGAYVVRWRIISADDHVVRGSYWFGVGFAAAPPPAAELLGSGAPHLSFLEVAARWLGLCSLLVLAGGPLFRLAMRATPIPPRTRGPWLAVTATFVVAQILLAAAQCEALAEAPLPQALTPAVLGEVLFSGRFALLWWIRLLLGVTLGVLLYRPSRAGLAALACIPLLVATSLGSHAAGARIAVPLAVAIDSVHLGAAALWVGTLFELCMLVPLLLGLPAQERSAALRSLVPRVSLILLPTVLVLIATGIFSAWEQVATWKALSSTAHGQSLVVKLALLLPLLAIAAMNLFFVRPRIAAGAGAEAWLPRRFLRNVRAEAALGVALLLPVALLATLPPSAQQPFPEELGMARQAGDLRVALRVKPAWVGVSSFEVALSDANAVPPTDVRQVVLTFTMEGMNMGRTNVTMTPRGNGHYQTTGFYIGMPGISQIGVAVNRGGAADRSAVFRVEVPDVNPWQLGGLAAVLSPGRGARVVEPGSAARGRDLYGRHCGACHGESGTGNGPAAASLLPPPADLTLHTRWHPDEQLEWFIAHGVPGTSMIGFADRLSVTERREVVNHLHALASVTTMARGAPVAATQLAGTTRGALPLPGRLVFGPDFDNNLWLLQLSDGKAQPLTSLGPKEFPSNPAWSPDGRQIAFSYYRLPDAGAIPVPDGTDLYLMDSDGKRMRALSIHKASGEALQYPAWSADGSAVYAGSAGPAGRNIERVSIDSGKRVRVITNAAFPALSADGRWLAYVRYAMPPERGESLWLSAPDGSRSREVIGAQAFAKFFGVRFSPDGNRLVFAAVGQPAGRLSFLEHLLGIRPAHANGDLWDLWVIDRDGSNLRPVTALGEDMPVAAWSPDGSHLAFLGGGSASSAEAGVTIVAPEHKELRRLTAQPGHRGLDWVR